MSFQSTKETVVAKIPLKTQYLLIGVILNHSFKVMEVFYGEILKQIRVTVIPADYIFFWIYTLPFEHCFYILLSISKLCHDQIWLISGPVIEKTEVSLESKNNYQPFQMWLIIQTLCWFDLGRLKFQSVLSYVQSCSWKFTSLHPSPSPPSQERELWWLVASESWLAHKELPVSNFTCLKCKQMNRSCWKPEVFTHPGPCWGHLEISEGISMS